MPEPDGNDLKAQEFKRCGTNSLEGQARNSPGVCVRTSVCEGIVKSPSDLRFDGFLAIQGDGLVEVLTEDPQIVEAEDVVGVVVGEERGVDEIDSLSYQLQPQFWWRIDQKGAPGCLDGHTTPSTVVASVP